jgi:hypothetical protein
MPRQETPPKAGPTGEPDNTLLDDPEKWTDEETTPVPARVFQKRSLGIDEALLSRIKSKRGPRIRSRLIDYVVPIGRRALEVAIKEAVSQKELNPRPSEWKPEWSLIADASQDAVAALARLFRAIDPHGKDAALFAPFIRQSRAGRVVASKADYRDAAEAALRDARILVEAKQIIGKLRADTVMRRDALMGLYPGSSQDHQKRAFVRILAEGWVFLTGEMPGKNRDPLKNPFLRVVEAAWMDWHQDDSSDAATFGEALDAAISSIDDAELNWLRAAGPGWLPGRV